VDRSCDIIKCITNANMTQMVAQSVERGRVKQTQNDWTVACYVTSGQQLYWPGTDKHYEVIKDNRSESCRAMTGRLVKPCPGVKPTVYDMT